MKVVLVLEKVADELVKKVNEGVNALSVGKPEVSPPLLHPFLQHTGSKHWLWCCCWLLVLFLGFGAISCCQHHFIEILYEGKSCQEPCL